VEFTVDGVPSTTGTTVSFSPPTEMVAEVKVQTATYDASTGRVPGGNVNIVLRTGANQFDGNLQWFHTEQHLEGLTLFSRQFLYDPSSGPVTDANRALANPLNILNRYGTTVSGLVLLPKLYDGHDTTFWAFSGEGLSRPQLVPGSPVTVPSLAERTGDFSQLLKVGANYQVYDPATIAAAGNGRFPRQPFPGNIIPASRLDPLATSFLHYWPNPNQAGNADGVNNYSRSPPRRTIRSISSPSWITISTRTIAPLSATTAPLSSTLRTLSSAPRPTRPTGSASPTARCSTSST
jgi:hypothetical protein